MCSRSHKNVTMENLVMVKFLFLALFLTGCLCMELTLDRQVVVTHGSRTLCGVVTCSEESGSVVTGTDPPLAMANISSLRLFKTDRAAEPGDQTGKLEPQQRRLVAELTLEQAHLIRVSDGIKISGRLSPARASLRLEITKEKDCEAEFSCLARGGLDSGDGEGEIVSSTRLVQLQRVEKDDGDSNTPGGVAVPGGGDLGQVLSLVKQFGVSLANIGGKVNTLGEKIGAVETKVTEEIAGLQARINRMETSIERSIGETHVRLESGDEALKEDILTHLEDTLAPLQAEVSAVSHNLTQFSELFLSKVNDGLESLQQDIRSGNELVIQNVTGVCTCASPSCASGVSPLGKDGVNDKEKEEGEEDNSSISSVDTTELPIFELAPEARECRPDRLPFYRTLRRVLAQDQCHENSSSYRRRISPRDLIVCPDTNTEYIGPYLCDMHTKNGGWVVIQRRHSGLVDFYRGWSEYKNGFGSVHGEYWLGNEQIHRVTSSGTYELLVELHYGGKQESALYESFSLSGEDSGYALHLGRYIEGGALDSLRYHNGSKFSTRDRDNDASASTNCAETYRGGWWYVDCEASNLNGPWQAGHNVASNWRTLSGFNSVSLSEMKIRKVG